MAMFDSEGEMYLPANGYIQNGRMALGFFTFVHPDKLESIEDNLYMQTEESGNPINYATNPDFSNYIEGLEFQIKIEHN